MKIENNRLGVEIAFALYGAASRVIRAHKPFLEPLGLTFPQYLVVLELLDEAPLTVGELGLRLGMDTGTITPLLKRLQTSGKITRIRDQHDERRVLVELTAEGKVLENEIRQVNGKIKSACQLSESDLLDLRDKLKALAHPAE
ncbi:MAG: MarR family transcriptional regulator [Agrobacterium cavarae]|uniref:MarR family winged helix-turn-helix transcriptional regulator n=1 Tax=Agrobacterium cavarae TaxID=2528239 RepID=UPI0031A47D17